MILLLLSQLALAETVREAFPPPQGAERAAADRFGEYLRDLRVRPPDVPVREWGGGAVVGHHARVIDLPVVDGDLQQCADSIIRVRAEWQKSTGQTVMFHATSGDPMPWKRYQNGERARAKGNALVWSLAAAANPASWEQYLSDVFMYAGTASLAERETVADDHPDPGDMLVHPGFPGHAVVLLDVATKGDTTYVLVGEGYMPAQDFHVELGPHDGWWDFKDGVQLSHWPLSRDKLRRWK